jgi:hypothetical protein
MRTTFQAAVVAANHLVDSEHANTTRFTLTQP